MKNNLKKGFSLISLIIIVIVIIIFATIIIFNGLNTPDKANLARFMQEISDFRIAVQKVLDFKTKHPNEEITPTSDVYYYNLFIEDMGNEIDNFQTYLNLHIING